MASTSLATGYLTEVSGVLLRRVGLGHGTKLRKVTIVRRKSTYVFPALSNDVARSCDVYDTKRPWWQSSHKCLYNCFFLPWLYSVFHEARMIFEH